MIDIDNDHNDTFIRIGQLLWLSFLEDEPSRKAIAFVVSHHTLKLISYGKIAEFHSATPELIVLQDILSSTPMYITYAIFVTHDLQITGFREHALSDLIWKADDLTAGQAWDIVETHHFEYLKSKELI